MNPIIKSIISLSISLFTLTGLFSQEIVGTWKGAIDVQGVSLDIVFHIEQQDTLYTSLMDSPMQGAFGIPTTKTTFENGQLQIVMSNLAASYQGQLKSDTLTGTFTQGGLPFPLILTRGEKNKLVRPQEPTAPYPYDVENITFPNTKEKIELAATLTLPKQAGKSPAVILIAGSGPNDRDETIFGHKPFWILADYLTRQGIAVLRYDKRGVDKSGGEFFTATSQHFADDAQAAFNYLKTRKEIDPANIGLIGHSEGGIIAPIVAADNSEVKFIVLMAGLGVTGTELVLDQHQYAFDKTSLTKEGKETLRQSLTKVYSSVTSWEDYVGTDEERKQLKDELSIVWEQLPEELHSKMPKDAYLNSVVKNIASPWFRYFLNINPSEHLQKLSIPVLAINGENDTQVNYEKNLNEIETALKKGNNKHYTIKSYPHLNHVFQESTTGDIEEYIKIEQTMSPEVLSDIAKWIKLQVE